MAEGNTEMDGGKEEKPRHTTPSVAHIHTEGVAHEESDVEVGGVAWFTAGLAVLMILTAALMWGMFRFFARTEHIKEPPPTSLTREKKPENTIESMFPEPRLQQHPVMDLEKYREEKDAMLTTYGWVDPATGVVRIPIEEAKKRLLKQGLPYRQNPQSTMTLVPEVAPDTSSKQNGATSNDRSKTPAAPTREVKH